MSFFYSTTLHSFLFGSPQSRGIRQSIYYAGHGRVLTRLLERKQAKLLIACLKEDEDVIIGYMLSEPEIMHFVYVKRPFRNMGIAKQLWQMSDLDYACQVSHKTYDMVRLMNKHPKITYNPYLLMEQEWSRVS